MPVCNSGHAIRGGPAHETRERLRLPFRAVFPDACVGNASQGNRLLRQCFDQAQSRRRSFCAHAFIQENRRQRQHHFSKDVVLGVQGRRVPDSHGLFAVVSGPVFEYGFVEVMRSVHAV